MFANFYLTNLNPLTYVGVTSNHWMLMLSGNTPENCPLKHWNYEIVCKNIDTILANCRVILQTSQHSSSLHSVGLKVSLSILWLGGSDGGGLGADSELIINNWIQEHHRLECDMEEYKLLRRGPMVKSKWEKNCI